MCGKQANNYRIEIITALQEGTFTKKVGVFCDSCEEKLKKQGNWEKIIGS